jgi:hypothetical protein
MFAVTSLDFWTAYDVIMRVGLFLIFAGTAAGWIGYWRDERFSQGNPTTFLIALSILSFMALIFGAGQLGLLVNAGEGVFLLLLLGGRSPSELSSSLL